MEVSSDGALYLDALAHERLRAAAAELAAALGQVDLQALDPVTRGRIERARAASKTITRLSDVEPQDSRNVDPAPALPDMVGYQVLLAVDGTEAQVELGRLIAETGARYDLARDGAAALVALTERDFDLAIIDADLRQVPGRDVIASLRARSDGQRRIPVLALSPPGADAQIQAMRRAGANDVLCWEATDVAGLARALTALVQDRPAEIVTGDDDLVLDEGRFARLLEIAGDEGAGELCERLLEDLREVERGLGRALSEQNAAELRTQTHVLVALAGAVGADSLQKLTEALNGAAHRRAGEEMQALGRRTLRQLTALIRLISERDFAGHPG